MPSDDPKYITITIYDGKINGKEKRICVTPSAVKKLLRFSMSPLTIKKFGLFFCASTFPVGKICAKTEKRSILHF